MTTPAPWKSGIHNPYEMHARLQPAVDSETEWLLQRRTGIGASDCAPVLGMGRYDTPFDVWLDKTGQVPLINLDSEPAEWGRILEPVIRDRAALKLGLPVSTVPSLQSRKHPWQYASLDAVLWTPEDGPVPLEVKSTSVYLAKDWEDDQVPDAAELQVQHQLAVCGAPYAYVAGLIGGQRLVVRRVDRDQELIDHITDEEAAFWWHVQERTAPPVIARDSIATIIGAAGRADARTLVLGPEDAYLARGWMSCYDTAAASARRVADVKSEARNTLAFMAQGHDEVAEQNADGTTTVLYRLQRGVFSTKRFRDDNPDLAPLYEKKITAVDTAALRAEDPTLYRQYQSVSIRPVNK